MRENSQLNTYLQYIQHNEISVVITEQQMQEFLLEMPEIGKNVTTFINWAEKKLKSLYNISFEPIKKLGKAQGERLKSEYKKGTPPEVLGKKVADSAKNFLVKQGKTAIQNIGDLTVTEKIAASLLSFIVIIFVSGLLQGLLVAVVSSGIAQQLTAMVIAPMVEEAAKTFFIQQGMPWTGTGIVFGIEAIGYISMMIFSGLNVTRSIIARLCGLLMHFSTTFIQKQYLEKNTVNETEAMYLAWSSGVMIHASWNIIAIVLNERILQLLI